MPTQQSVTTSLVFRMGKLGVLATDRFAQRLAALGLRPRHCGVLELLRNGPIAQLDLATTLGVTPSVVVDMLDELETVGAVRRVRAGPDRRRQHAELTPTGRTLSDTAARLAHRTDLDFLGSVTPSEAKTLHKLLGKISEAGGLTV